MKKTIAYILVLATCLTMLCANALAESWYCYNCYCWNEWTYCGRCGKANPQAISECWSLAIDKISTRNGPSPRYTDMGTYNLKGQYLRIVAKAWDNHNGIWWVKVDVPSAGLLWTGAKRFDSSTLQLSVLSEEVWSYNPTSTDGSASGGSNSNSDSPYSWLIGKWGMVCVNEGHARTGAGTNYSKTDVVYYGEWYEILEVKRGDTTKDWCQVRGTTGKTFWISTGLLEIDGYQGGTIYGNWAP